MAHRSMNLSKQTPTLLKAVVLGVLIVTILFFATMWFIADDPFCWRGYIAYDGNCAWE